MDLEQLMQMISRYNGIKNAKPSRDFASPSLQWNQQEIMKRRLAELGQQEVFPQQQQPPISNIMPNIQGPPGSSLQDILQQMQQGMGAQGQQARPWNPLQQQSAPKRSSTLSPGIGMDGKRIDYSKKKK